MSKFLGIDTSNYTTSVAVFDSCDKSVLQCKRLLPVKSGEKGLRQSDAVFHHTVQLPEVLTQLYDSFDTEISAVGVSSKPRDVEGSYMPCFLVGKNVATAVSLTNRINLHQFSHQAGHIMAALYSCGRLDLVNEEFIAFHLSGGTTEAVLVKPDDDTVFKCEIIAKTLDLNAGQAIDRVGVMLGLDFPCGKELEKMALKSDKKFNIKPSLKGLDCNLSGIENKCKVMLSKGERQEDISLYCIEYIKSTLSEMTIKIIEKYGQKPLVYAGGVMSNSIIRKYIEEKFDGKFASSEFSCDNAAGIALLTAYKEKKL